MDRNKELLNTKQAAEILGVSVSTIRRWCDNGTLTCYRIGNSRYRKFERSVVEKLKAQFYGENSIVKKQRKINRQLSQKIFQPNHIRLIISCTNIGGVKLIIL